ncbi:MAG: endolytic transglycosylase MltG [Atopobiaceae bacterium]|nr:endolytic transglycosylase MltG [Atopobiaceae bacterium]
MAQYSDERTDAERQRARAARRRAQAQSSGQVRKTGSSSSSETGSPDGQRRSSRVRRSRTAQNQATASAPTSQTREIQRQAIEQGQATALESSLKSGSALSSRRSSAESRTAQAAGQTEQPKTRAKARQKRTRIGTSRKKASQSPVGSTGAVGFESAARPGGSAKRIRDNSSLDPSRIPIIAAILAVAVLLVLAFFLLPRCSRNDDKPTIEPGQQVEVAIPDGAGGTSIAQILVDNGIISSTDEFFAEVQKQNADQSLKSGTYSLITGATASEVVKQLVTGPNSEAAKLTIIEGLTTAKTADVVQEVLGIPAADFLAQAKASNYVSDYEFLANVNDDSLEGFLYPKTYDFSGKEINADTVIRAMLDQYRIEVSKLDWESSEVMISQRYGIDFDDYDMLILASIVEKEAINSDDRTKVASVFLNRLSEGMRLQSDATMSIVTGGAVTADDLKIESPYNSYFNDGLPPTPICNPSLEAIQTTLNPADTNYFYFFIEGDQISEFSETFEGHNEVIEQVRESYASESGDAEESE